MSRLFRQFQYAACPRGRRDANDMPTALAAARAHTTGGGGGGGGGGGVGGGGRGGGGGRTGCILYLEPRHIITVHNNAINVKIFCSYA